MLVEPLRRKDSEEVRRDEVCRRRKEGPWLQKRSAGSINTNMQCVSYEIRKCLVLLNDIVEIALNLAVMYSFSSSRKFDLENKIIVISL